MRQISRVLPATLLVGAFVVACTSQVGTVPPSQSTAASTLPSAEPSATTPVDTPAPDAAPEELQGRWRSTSGPVKWLTLRESSYAVEVFGGGSAQGRISVDGDTILFHDADLCPGEGKWTWSIDGDGVLSFTPQDPRDPCGGRIAVLEDVTYQLPADS